MSWFSQYPLSSSTRSEVARKSQDSGSTKSGSLMDGEQDTAVSIPASTVDTTITSLPPAPLDAHTDSRAIVRLLQCHFCDLLLQQPVSLPCGNAICRKCLPKSHKRENITYPAVPSRLEGFVCPFEECRQEHAVGDANLDVTLSKIMDKVNVEIVRYRMIAGDMPLQVDEKPHWRHLVGVRDDKANSRRLNGGRLLATFTMAELGEMRYDSEAQFQALSGDSDTSESLDRAFLSQIKAAVQNEVDCQICWGLLLDPLTTTCGHSFCRGCVARLLDHSNLCPVCRTQLSIRPGAVREPSNLRLNQILDSLVPELVLAKAQMVEAEEATLSRSGKVPLFVVTLAFPQMPTFLHVFEPRYRLMIRRAMAGDRKFGMVAYNGRGDAQGDLGVTQFMQHGTLLHIDSIQILPDGRSVIQTTGVSRFRILDHDVLDDYAVASTERVDDIPLAAEEALEASELSQSNSTNSNFSSSNRPLASMTTVELMQLCADFIERMQSQSATWLAANVLQAYGDMPTDPAVFPYWFASVLPIAEAEKYRLLPTTSVRERLKITAGWVRKVQEILARIQRNPWATGSMPTSAESSDDEDNFDAEATENDDEDEGEEAGLNTSFATANEEHDDITPDGNGQADI